MTVHVVKVPDIGEGIAEVELVAWHVKPGDVVAEDQALADVMTDKASVEIPSPLAGTVMALGGEVGQMLAVGAELIRIKPAGTGRVRATPAAPVLSSAPPAAAAPAPIATPAPRGSEPTPPAAAQRPIASPAVRARAWELGIDLNAVAASGLAGRIV